MSGNVGFCEETDWKIRRINEQGLQLWKLRSIMGNVNRRGLKGYWR